MLVSITPGTDRWSARSRPRRVRPVGSRRTCRPRPCEVQYAFIDLQRRVGRHRGDVDDVAAGAALDQPRANDRQPLTTPPRLMSSTRSNCSAGVSRKTPAWPIAGVVHHDVGHAVLGADLARRTARPRRRRTTSSGVGVRDAAARGDLRGGVLDAGLVDVADDHLGALAGERQRGLAADAAARAGHRHQRVAEVFALAADLRAQQRPARRLAVQEVDELGDRVARAPAGATSAPSGRP